MVKLLFFGRLSDYCKNVPETIDASTPREILELLQQDFPILAAELRDPHVLIAVNKSIADWDTKLTDSCEVAFLPPVTGG